MSEFKKEQLTFLYLCIRISAAYVNYPEKRWKIEIRKLVIFSWKWNIFLGTSSTSICALSKQNFLSLHLGKLAFPTSFRPSIRKKKYENIWFFYAKQAHLTLIWWIFCQKFQNSNFTQIKVFHLKLVGTPLS